MTELSWADNDAAFREQLTRGRRAELRLALDLLDTGFTVRVGSLRFRNSFADRHQFADDVDVEVEGGHVLEVKISRGSFSGPDDWPFNTVFVCSERRWLARSRHPCAIVVESEPTGSRVVIPSTSRPRWTRQVRYDTVRKCEEAKLCCDPSDLLTYDKLVDHLRTPHWMAA